MSRSTDISRRRTKSLALAALGCIMAVCMLVGGTTEAHALFSASAHGEVSHSVKAFPMGMTVETSIDEVRSERIDRDGLTVRVEYSDGTIRVLGSDEYELEPAQIAAGTFGPFEGEASYREAGHEVSAGFSLDVTGAYGAQYGDTLVFGRGLPAETYEDRPLTNVTWGIETAECAPLWTKSALVRVVDIATVRPCSISSWFDQATSLQTVVLDQLDASSLTDMRSTFASDAALKSVDLSGWDTSNVTDMGACFTGCSSLTAIEGSGELDTSSVRNMASMFASCSALSAVDVASWDTSSVTAMNNMFHSCSSLTDIDVSSWNTSSVTTLNRIFYKTGLRSIDLSKWDVGKVVDAELLVWSSYSLASVGDLSNWNTSSMQKIGGAFAFTSVANVGNIGKWNISNVTAIDHLFQYCHSLTYCGDLSGWNTSKCTSFTNMFQYCNNLTTLGDISRWNTANVTSMFQTFQFDSKLVADCSSWNVSKVTDHSNFNGSGATGVTAPRW